MTRHDDTTTVIDADTDAADAPSVVEELPATVEGWSLEAAAEHIADVQRPSGLVPWYTDGPADPWDHVESAMGLTVGGHHSEAREAYRWLARNQLSDGSWWASYSGDEAVEDRKETHRSAYVAVGAWHHYLVTGDRSFLDELWPTVEAAIEFALAHQTDHGEVHWSVEPDGTPERDALVSGSASIYKSLECAITAARVLGHSRERWADARRRLGAAIRERPERFDRTWESKERFAMHWFYPVLCGVVDGDRARARLEERRDRFVEPELGCRCVSDEPWVTVAESCELVLALAAADRRGEAAHLFEWLFQFTDDEGVFYTGYQFEDEEIWPEDRPTWTAGAALLAADALGGITEGTGLFTG